MKQIGIDRNQIADAFHRQAHEYDQAADVQYRVVARMMELLEQYVPNRPESVLDIGCGTGLLLTQLQQRYEESYCWGLDLAFNMSCHAQRRCGGNTMVVNGDAEQLPFADKSFELVVSTSMFQWLEHLSTAISEALRVVVPGGMVAIALFGANTLKELQDSYGRALSHTVSAIDPDQQRLHRFFQVNDIADEVEQHNVELLVLQMEQEVEQHENLYHLLQAIKSVGAGTTPRHEKTGGLGWRGILNRMGQEYRNKYGDADGILPATYEVIYLLMKSRIHNG